VTPYAAPPGGLPEETALHTGRARFTEAWAVIPAGVQRDIVTSLLPGWTGTRAWILARPLTGFAETFAWAVVEVGPRGGSAAPEPEDGAEAVIFVTHGALWLNLDGQEHELGPGGYAYAPPRALRGVHNGGVATARFHWIRKLWEPAPGLAPPAAFVTDETEVPAEPMPGSGGRWATQRFADPADPAHDMHVNIVSFAPGASIPFEEMHVMEHGIYVLEGKAVYRLNRDWVEVGPGDFLWLRAFCPQACYAGGPGRFRYLLYKDVNRHPRLYGPGAFGERRA
jgi:(S)-ureidoglycine aminohydrolase